MGYKIVSITNVKFFWCVFCIFIFPNLEANLNQMVFSPFQILTNTNLKQSLINSVDFHPQVNQFCVTFTQNNCIIIYELDRGDRVSIFQVIQNSSSKLERPQHALFSKNGKSLVVTNWSKQKFNVYHINAHGSYKQKPTAILPFHLPGNNFRPHGMMFSPDGQYLAIAFGASKKHPRAVALYHIKNLETTRVNFNLVSLLQENEIGKGIPKGIAFSPDGSCLLVTFAETDTVAVYTIDRVNEKIIPIPRQLINDTSSLSRPEDIKFTIDGNYCAVSNSGKDTVAFYMFDKENNYFINETPSYVIKNPEGKLCFPHGLAFSSDGQYLVITQFGTVLFELQGELPFHRKKIEELITLYKLK